jgi:hypothetical protein
MHPVDKDVVRAVDQALSETACWMPYLEHIPMHADAIQQRDATVKLLDRLPPDCRQEITQAFEYISEHCSKNSADAEARLEQNFVDCSRAMERAFETHSPHAAGEVAETGTLDGLAKYPGLIAELHAELKAVPTSREAPPEPSAAISDFVARHAPFVSTCIHTSLKKRNMPEKDYDRLYKMAWTLAWPVMAAYEISSKKHILGSVEGVLDAVRAELLIRFRSLCLRRHTSIRVRGCASAHPDEGTDLKAQLASLAPLYRSSVCSATCIRS